MGKVIMTCGCEATGDEWMEGWWWKEWNGALSYGCLCDKCAKTYRAVRANSYDEADSLLKNSEGITLQDICAEMEGATRTTKVIDGIEFDVVEIKPKENDVKDIK